MKIKTVLFFVFFPLVSVMASATYKVDFVLGKAQYKAPKDDLYQELQRDTLILENYFIRTGKGAVVKLLDSQNTQIMVLSNTTFHVMASKEKSRVFKIFAGLAEFNTSAGSNLLVKTPTLSAGVRGTLFKAGYDLDGLEKVVVYDGKVAVSSPLYPDKGDFLLEAGSKIEWNPAKETFSSFLIKSAQGEDLDFYLKDDLPAPQVLQKQATMPEENLQEAQEIDPKKLEEEKKEELPLEETPKEEPSTKKTTEEFFKPKEPHWWNIHFNLGGVEKSGYFYHGIMIMPEFIIKKWITLRLFLPIFYDGQSKIYNVKKWGNYEEWNFGGTKDKIHDLLLKIHTVQLLEKGDVFYLKLGTLDKITLGNGFMFNQYNASPFFPAERSLGLEVGFDMGLTALDFFVNDIYNPEVFGTRFFFRPFYALPVLGKFQIGLQLGVDINPLGDSLMNPAFFYFALDFTFPLASFDFLTIVLFADIAKQGVYYDDWDSHPDPWSKGLDFLNFHLNGNYAVNGGIRGNITKYAHFDLRYYYLHSGFVPDFFDSFYIVRKKERLHKVLTPHLDDEHVLKAMLGVSLDFLVFQGGYTYTLMGDKTDNRLFLSLTTKRGTLWRFYFKAMYEKKNLKEIFSTKYKNDALLDLQIGYIFTNNADLVLRKLVAYNQQGEQESQISLETRFLF